MQELRLNNVEVQHSSLSTRNYKAKSCSLLLPVRPDNLDQALTLYRNEGFAGHYCGLAVSGVRDLSFLQEFPDMLYLELHDASIDANKLEPLRNLRGLSMASAKSGVDFAWFPQLEVFHGKWHRDHRNLHQLQELRWLQLGDLQSPTDDLAAIANITRLDRLLLTRPKIRSLDGIESLEDLQICEVFSAAKLESLVALTNGLPGLRELAIERCMQIASYAPLAAIKRLRRLRISDSAPMADLQWTSGMNYLDQFSFVGTNVEDGDMTPLLELPRLRFVGTMSKRHYSHSFEQMLKLFEERWPT